MLKFVAIVSLACACVFAQAADKTPKVVSPEIESINARLLELREERQLLLRMRKERRELEKSLKKSKKAKPTGETLI